MITILVVIMFIIFWRLVTQSLLEENVQAGIINHTASFEVRQTFQYNNFRTFARQHYFECMQVKASAQVDKLFVDAEWAIETASFCIFHPQDPCAMGHTDESIFSQAVSNTSSSGHDVPSYIIAAGGVLAAIMTSHSSSFSNSALEKANEFDHLFVYFPNGAFVGVRRMASPGNFLIGLFRTYM